MQDIKKVVVLVILFTNDPGSSLISFTNELLKFEDEQIVHEDSSLTRLVENPWLVHSNLLRTIHSSHIEPFTIYTLEFFSNDSFILLLT